MGNSPGTAPKQQYGIGQFFDLCGVVMSKVGTIGFIVISVFAYIFFYVPQGKKNELTDTWILFKGSNSNNICVFVVIVMFALFIIQQYFYSRAIKAKDERINEMAEEKSRLQELLLQKDLNSTNNNNKKKK